MNFSQVNMRNRLLILVCLIVSIISPLRSQDLSNLKGVKPVTFNGSIGINTNFYNANGILARQDPFSYGLNANATVSLYGISMPFSFSWYNKTSNYTQPFNQFGISPTYKWITCHFGYRNLTFSEFSLSGHTFLGAGVELNPGKIRVGAVYGLFNSNSEYNPYMADSLPKLTRKGWALKLGYGTAQNFVDFSMLRIGDNTDNYTEPKDTLPRPTPEQNMVYGITSKLAIIEKLSLEFDGSMSFYTDNRKASRFATIENGWLAFSDNFMTINTTSTYYTAFKTALMYKFTDKISTGLEYRRIGTDYKSMGAYFFNNDVANLTINQTWSFLKDKIAARGSIGFQRDNLSKTKIATSKRTIGSMNLSYILNEKFAVDALHSNFTTNQKAGTIPIVDSLKLFQMNHNFSLLPRFTKVTAERTQTVMLNLNLMKLDDKNKTTQNLTETNTTIITLSYVLGFIPKKLNLNCGLNYTNLKNSVYKNSMSGFMFGLAKTMLSDALSINWNNSFMINKINADKGSIFNMTLSANYRFAKKHTINLNMNYIKNSFDIKSTTPSYNEIRGDLSYVFTF
jgi:hypothetical protein